MKKALIISTSIREGSNSERLAKEVLKGAKEAGLETSFVSLKGKSIAFCRGCLACQKLGRCVIDDDANAITDEIANSDIIVFATPIYYYEMAGQMKTLIDRANSLYVRQRRFKDVYLLSVAAEEEDGVPEKALSGLQGWVDCFEGVRLKGSLFVGGVGEPLAVEKSDALAKAYEFGRKLAC